MPDQGLIVGGVESVSVGGVTIDVGESCTFSPQTKLHEVEAAQSGNPIVRVKRVLPYVEFEAPTYAALDIAEIAHTADKPVGVKLRNGDEYKMTRCYQVNEVSADGIAGKASYKFVGATCVKLAAS